MDYYHHAKPTLQIGKYIVTGSWADNLGRYGVDDFYHPNGFDPLMQALQEEYALLIHEQPLTNECLRAADIVFVFTPDSPQIRPDTPVFTDEEINNLEAFVKEGGSLFLVVNSHHPTEKFELVQLRKLFGRFGLDWHADDTKYVNIHIGPDHPYFYDIDTFHYGAGCTLSCLPGTQGETLLHVHGEVGDEHVQGPGLILTRHGKGKVMACGDTGAWGANMSRPWAENEKFLLEMFRYLKPDSGIRPPQYSQGQRLRYHMTMAQSVAIPLGNSLNEIAQPEFKMFVPREQTRVPYSEFEADIDLTCAQVDENGSMHFEAKVENGRRFDRSVDGLQKGTVAIESNRLGSIVEINCDETALQPLEYDLSHLLAFIPNDGVRIGDRWTKQLLLEILPLRGIDLGPVRTVETQMCYARDEMVGDRPCRVFMTSAAEWLDNLDLSIKDLLPEGATDGPNGKRYQFHSPRGGQFMVKREQWVDRQSGVVLRAKVQRRLIAWIRDLDKPVGKTVAEIDDDMVTLVAKVTWFELQ